MIKHIKGVKMKIDLTEIYKGLKAWRHERGLTTENQKQGYIVNVMKEFGELAQALRDYEKIKNGERVLRAGTFDIKSTLGEMIIFEGTTKGELEISLEKVEHEIIDALCNISVFTINAGADVNCNEKIEIIDTTMTTRCNSSLSFLLSECGNFDYYGKLSSYVCFNQILLTCAKLCENYGFNFEIAMLETIKEISSRTGTYDEVSKKWVKDTSDEARKKWYQADYEKARR